VPAVPDDAPMEEVLRYMQIRDQQRIDAAAHVLQAMTGRERRLFREAAVMGYVQGVRSVPGGHNATIPPDSNIVFAVIAGARSMKDLYPVINGVADGSIPAVPSKVGDLIGPNAAVIPVDVLEVQNVERDVWRRAEGDERYGPDDEEEEDPVYDWVNVSRTGEIAGWSTTEGALGYCPLQVTKVAGQE
jgi:hypothetical protein